MGDEWFTPGRFAVVLGILICACFPQVICGLESFVCGDANQFAYPVAFYLRESFWRGELPLWDPSSSCGIPFLAQWNTMALYPPSLFYLLFPLPWAFEVFCLAHLFWAGLGMYCLAYRWTSSRLGAAVAGGAFAFNGLMWCGVAWPHLLAALAWMPWVVWTAERAWRQGGRALAVAALVGAMQMLSGGAEAILQTWLVLAVFWMADCAARHPVETVKPEPSGSQAKLPAPRRAHESPAVEARGFRRGASGGRWTMAWRFGLVVAWVAGLAAAQLLPFLSLMRHSQRAVGSDNSSLINYAAMPLTGWANYLVPLFHCSRDSLGVYSGQAWLSSYYLGVGVVALALLAVWRARVRNVRLLAGIALFGLTMALGRRGGVYEWGRAVLPGVRMMRFPIKFVMLVNLALPLLAAYGLGWVRRLPAEAWTRERRRLLGLVVALAAAIGLIAGAAWTYPLHRAEGWTVSGNAAARLGFLLLGFGVIVLLRGAVEGKTRRLLETGLVVLLWFDVFTHAPEVSPTAPSAILEPNLAQRSFDWDAGPAPGGTRAMLDRDAFWRLSSTTLRTVELDVKARRLALFLNNNLLDGVPTVTGIFSCDLREYFDVFQSLYFKTNLSAGLKDFLGVSRVGVFGDAVEWIKRPTALPLMTAGQQPEFRGDPDAIRAMAEAAFNPLRTVYLPPAAGGQLAVSGPARARVIDFRFAAHRVEADVEADAPTMVVVAQTFYPGWEASVDGRPATLWRAKHAFQAVEVSAGKHHVALVYRDPNFLWGVGVSLLSLAGCGVGLKLGTRQAPCVCGAG